MTRRGAIGLLVGTAVLSLAGCGVFGKSVRYRYRMAVEVETPMGLKTGSSVIQVVETESQGLEGSHLDVRVTGEAVAVDLPGGQTLFALLDGKPVAAITMQLPEKDADWYQIGKQLKRQNGVYDVPRDGPTPFSRYHSHPEMESWWPMLVHFRDINDPKSVERINPDTAEASLGAGMRIRRITVQITDDAVTNGIEKRLGWLEGLRNGGRLRGEFPRNAHGMMLPPDRSRPELNLGFDAFVLDGLV